MVLFALATLLPVALIGVAAMRGGGWALAALLVMTAMAAGLDALVARVTPALEGAEFPAGDALSVTLGLAHFALIALVLPALAGPGLGPAAKLGVFVAAGLFFGQVSHPNAHELIHRGGRVLHGLGVALYVSLLYGHHASAHVLVHHVHVATRSDPSTARRGESFYRFARRGWMGAFRAGLRAEAARLARVGRPGWRNPYVIYVFGAVLTLAAAFALAGIVGVALWLGLAAFAQVQILMSDYVQHYGLTRSTLPSGRAEPVRPRHSWNSPHWYSSAMMLNAPRHSDHHAHPARPYPALRLDAGPELPHSLPVMACIALWPRLWRRVMDPRVAAWEAQS
ncbi:MAG: alkane 1-monooxygenase [Limimaricola sp.]|nr:alkane 1-monooxygenase [Limimaricola sp.]